MKEMFGRPAAAKLQPKTRLLMFYRGQEQTISKNSKGLWGAWLSGVYIQNSRLGDLIEQIECNGGTVTRVPL